MKKQFLFFAVLVGLLTAIASCREKECWDRANPDCANYELPIDPCASQKPINAEFAIEQNIQIFFDIFLWPTDGVIYHPVWPNSNSSALRLRALEDSATSYKWIIGADTTITKTRNLWFPPGFEGQNIPIKLIVEGNPRLQCFPNDNGMDTVITYVQVRDWFQNPIFGKFNVAWDDAPADSFVVGVRSRSQPLLLDYGFEYSNFANLGDTTWCYGVGAKIFHGYFYTQYNACCACGNLSGRFWNNVDGTFEGRYKTQLNLNPIWNPDVMEPRYEKHFKGRRIN